METNTIIKSFEEESSLVYLITGVRGSGKTVLLSHASKCFAEKEGWIVIDLNPEQDLLSSLVSKLYAKAGVAKLFLKKSLSLSLGKISLSLTSGELLTDSESILEVMLKDLKRRKKRILVTIDEASNNKEMRIFAHSFQSLIRQNFPIYLLMTGLYENINAIQNDPQLTFLLRSPKITLGPLGLTQIARQYERALNISSDVAMYLAKETKGYAFAFQALGMIYYDNETLIVEEQLNILDEYLDEYVYQKIWSGLSEQDRNVVLQLSDYKAIKVKDICEATGMSSATFSKYRERLINKGLISANQHGYIELALPRFRKICEYYNSMLL